MDSSPARSAAPRKAARHIWGWVLLFGLALAVRLGCWMQYEAQHPLAYRPVIDEAAYEEWGLEIARGDWLGEEVFFQEPLYPYWIGLVYRVLGSDPPARGGLRVIQCALGALTALWVGALGRRLFGAGAGWVAGVAFAVYGPAVWMNSLLLKPNLFMPILVCLAWLLTGSRAQPEPGVARGAWPRWLGIGCVAGLGALLRGNMLLLLPVLAVWPFIERWAAGRGHGRACAAELGAFSLGVACVLLPVSWRNYAVGGEFVLTTSGAGTNLYGGNNLDNPYGRATEFDWVRGIPAFEADDWKHEAERRLGETLSPAEVSSYWMQQALRSLRDHPLEHAHILLNKLRLSLGSYEVPDNHSYAWDRRYLPLLRILPSYSLVGSLGLAGLVLFVFSGLRPRQGGAPHIALLYVLYLGTIVATVTSDRVRLPLLVLLCPFLGFFVMRALKPGVGTVRLLSSTALGLLLSLYPVLTKEQRAQDLVKRDYNLAVYLAEDQATRPEALALARSIDSLYPNSSRVLNLVSELEIQEGLALLAEKDGIRRASGQDLISAALERLKRVALHPATNARELYRANAIGGLLQLQLNNPQAAERLLRAALGFDPSAEGLRLALANALALLSADPAGLDLRQARLAEARELLRGLIAETEDASERQSLTQRFESLVD